MSLVAGPCDDDSCASPCMRGVCERKQSLIFLARARSQRVRAGARSLQANARAHARARTHTQARARTCPAMHAGHSKVKSSACA
eukprot:4923348-Pleurochrysis_carterae.AAC.1